MAQQDLPPSGGYGPIQYKVCRVRSQSGGVLEGGSVLRGERSEGTRKVMSKLCKSGDRVMSRRDRNE